MTDNEIIDRLMSANAYAEATLIKLETHSAKEALWKAEAIERLGKAQADAIWRRRVA